MLPLPHCRQAVAVALLATLAPTAQAQLFERLQVLTNRSPVGDPATAAVLGIEGPKSITSADLDGDRAQDFVTSNSDGTVTVTWGDPEPDSLVSATSHLPTGGISLRGIIIADLDADSHPDIATADPFSGHLYIFFGQAGRQFADATPVVTWNGARDLVAEDFDRDGLLDLAIGGINVGVRQYRNSPTEPGTFEQVADLAGLDPNQSDTPVPRTYSAKPVFSLRTFHPVDGKPPVLVASHAETDTVTIAQVDGSGVLQPALELRALVTSSPDVDLHHIELAPVLRPDNSSPVPDIIGSSKRWNKVHIWRGKSTFPYFDPIPTVEFSVSGAPRAAAAADFDNDGWRDIAVVRRNADSAAIYKNNQNGTFSLERDVPLGVSPRDIITPDIDADNTPDIVTTNRKSLDISLVITRDETAPPGAEAVTSMSYPTDGNPAGLALADLDGDGRDDVIQLHRSAGDISVRLSGPGGSLGAAEFYPMGIVPTQLSVSDVNGDGQPDVTTANLGRGNVGGSFTLRYGASDGTFGPPESIVIPPDETSVPGDRSTSIFAIVDADFDGDGIQDQAVGYYDCRVGFFRGLPGGGYEQLKVHRFVYESRVMVTGDFDQDGDIDLAGAGETGQVVVFENTGDLLTTETPRRYDYVLGRNSKSGVKSAVLDDYNNDGDPDLVIGTAQGSYIVLGSEGATFSPVHTPLAGESTTASLAGGDLDGDGSPDLAIACDRDSTITVLTLDVGGNFQPALMGVPVPSAEFIASGDIDGDGLTDLAGTGSTLWVALSGEGSTTPPANHGPVRPRLTHPVINEILAINEDIPVPSDGGKKADVLELYNGGDESAYIAGWTLRLEIPGDDDNPTETKDFTFPDSTGINPDSHLLVYFSPKLRSPLHTGFRLPGSGATLRLIDTDNNEVDVVEYPDQEEDVSYARYGDGISSFTYNPFPDPGSSNLDNGGVEPDFSLQTLDPASVTPGGAIQFFARATDDVGIVNVSIVYRRLDVTGSEPVAVPLFDDGAHGDGDRLDGRFAGTLRGLPDGAEIEFYVVATDLTDQTEVLPENASFSVPGLPIRNYTLAVGSPATNFAPGLEISEVLATNHTGIADETGTLEDWIEVRNTSDTPLDLSGLQLVQDLFDDDDRFTFEDGTIVAPGEHIVVWADNDEEEGPLHAPFRVDNDGEQTFLIGKTARGATAILSHVLNPPLEADQSYARLTPGGPFEIAVPSPGSQNLLTPVRPVYLPSDDSQPARFELLFRTTRGRTHAVQTSSDLRTWDTLTTLVGDGVERSVNLPVSAPPLYLRVKDL